MAWKNPPLKRSYSCNPELLVLLRERKGLKQRALAEVAGYSERLICKAEAGQSISTSTIADLASALGTPGEPIYPEDLITDPVKLAKDYIAAHYQHQAGIVDAIRHFLHDDVIFRVVGDPKQIPFAGEHRGIAAVERMFDIFFSVLEVPANHDYMPCYTFMGQGNEVRVFGECWIHPIGKPMEKPISLSIRMVFQRGNLIFLEDVYDTLAGKEALEA